MASTVTPFQLGIAARLDKEGFKILEAQFQQERGHCIVHSSESNERCTELLESVGRLEADEKTRFLVEFANIYVPNLMRVYSILNSGHHSSSVYNTMVESVVDLPQFSRWIRDSREGPNFVNALIHLLSRLPINEIEADWVAESQKAARLVDRLAVLRKTTMLVFEYYPEEAEELRLDDKMDFFAMDGWVSVFGQKSNGTWVEVVKDQVQLQSPVHVLFI